MNERGTLLLLVDGLDEIAPSAWPMLLFEAVTRFGSPPASKVMITCRSLSFDEQITQFMKTSPSARVLELDQLDDSQIDTYLRAGAESKQVALLPLRTRSLRDLARRPLLLNMIAEVAPRLRGRQQLSVGRLYEAFVTRSLDRERHKSNSPSPAVELTALSDLVKDTEGDARLLRPSGVARVQSIE